MPPYHEPIVWTTADELASVRKLFVAGQVALLRRYLYIARYQRRWGGEGMEVEPGVVILQVEDWLIELTKGELKNGDAK